jgi:DNA-binding FadR family transcriptional regulator
MASSSSRFETDGADAAAYRAERLRLHADLVSAIADGDVDAVRRAVARHNDSH